MQSSFSAVSFDNLMKEAVRQQTTDLLASLLAALTQLGYTHYTARVTPTNATVQLWQDNLSVIQCSAPTLLEAIEGALVQAKR